MFYFYGLWSIYICNCTSNSQYSIVDTRRELEFFCRRYSNFDSFLADICKLFYVDIRHFSIGMNLFSGKPYMLHFLGFHYFFFQFFTRQSRSLFSEFSCLDTRHLYKDIDTIKNRSWKTRSIFVDRHWRTNAWLFRITHIATRTRIHGTNKGKTSWITTSLIYPIDSYFAIFKGLSQRFKNWFTKF